MSEERVERRFAAISAADVVGCSRLMEANEECTLATIRQHRRELFDPTITKHGGRIFKAMIRLSCDDFCMLQLTESPE
jgi:adenylate cyclase